MLKFSNSTGSIRVTHLENKLLHASCIKIILSHQETTYAHVPLRCVSLYQIKSGFEKGHNTVINSLPIWYQSKFFLELIYIECTKHFCHKIVDLSNFCQPRRPGTSSHVRANQNDRHSGLCNGQPGLLLKGEQASSVSRPKPRWNLLHSFSSISNYLEFS